MSPSPFVRSELEGDVLRLRLDRPDRLNAVSEELYADLEAALLAAATEPGARALLLTGEGRAFCAGADLKAHASRERDAAERRAYVWAGQRVCRLLQRAPQPVVAAVQGYALGAGAELALSADVVICADDAQFGFPEVGLGTFVGGGISHRLAQQVGQLRAKQLLLLGDRVGGRQAAEWGLATRAVPAAELERESLAIAQRLAAQPALPSRLAKKALNRAGALSADEAMTFEAEALLACMGSEDWKGGVRGFAGGAQSEEER